MRLRDFHGLFTVSVDEEGRVHDRALVHDRAFLPIKCCLDQRTRLRRDLDRLCSQ
jgi:hypothetical protein